MAKPPTALKTAALLRSAQPKVMGPLALGLTLLLGNVAFAVSAPWSWLAGIGLTAWGLGLGFWNYRRRLAQLQSDHLDVQQSQQQADQQAALEHLAQRLQADDDARTQAFLTDLRRCGSSADVLAAEPSTDPSHERFTAQLIADLRELVSAGIQALRHSADLWDQAQAMQTDAARQPLLEQRQAVVAEIALTVAAVGEHLGAIQQRRVRGSAGTAGPATGNPVNQLAELRQRLDTNLEVVRRVDERMSSLDEQGHHRYEDNRIQ